jgi:hypothetical protein
MTTRLERAISQLPPEKLEELVNYAERLAQEAAPPVQKPRFLKLDWVGMAADAYPEHASGVDAAHAAARMWREAVERSLPR